ncbi:MAG: hypothetical protein CSA35_01920 [Dethiosulfovibrio peptidovorans]|nr:MAG: hypothetical protein CSA35_01920 [Dethiosulfovibrio peptidovorans]
MFTKERRRGFLKDGVLNERSPCSQGACVMVICDSYGGFTGKEGREGMVRLIVLKIQKEPDLPVGLFLYSGAFVLLRVAS